MPGPDSNRPACQPTFPYTYCSPHPKWGSCFLWTPRAGLLIIIIIIITIIITVITIIITIIIITRPSSSSLTHVDWDMEEVVSGGSLVCE